MPQTYLGLDIGQSTIKAVLLTKKGLTGGQIIDSRILDIDSCGGIEQALKKLAEDKIFCGIPCCVSLPSTEFMFRQVTLPFRDENRIRKTLAFELEPMIPLPIEEVITDYLMIPHDGLLVAAMAKKSVSFWIEKVEENLGEVSVIDASPSILASQMTDSRKLSNHGIILDIGRHSTNVAFYEDNTVVNVRSMAFGGNLLTEALAQDLSVSSDEAENMKISQKYPQAGAKTIGTCRNFCSELKKTIEYMKINGVIQNEPARIILTGGGSLFEPLGKELETFFSLSVETLNLIQTKQLEIGKHIQSNFSAQILNTAIAAALRISAGRKSFNFRQGDFAAKNTSLDLKNQLKWTAVIAGIIVALLIVNQLFDYGLKSKHLSNIKKQIAYTFKKNFPEGGNMVDPVSQLKSRLTENKKTFDFYESLPEIKAVELLKEISGLISPSINVVITALTYENKVISIKGEAKTIDEVTLARNDLSKSRYFKDVTMGSTSLTKDGGKVDFSLRIDVK